MGNTYVIKFKFAGSGDDFWRKVYKGYVPENKEMIKDSSAMEHMYGKCIDENMLLWVKGPIKKNDFWYIEYSISGPEATDTGSNSIEKNFRKALEILHKQIQTLAAKSNTEMIYVKIKGHSRGGVTANRVLKYLVAFTSDPKIKICSVSFDPVPGQIAPQITIMHTGDDVNITLPEKMKSAVVYSLNPDKGMLNPNFTPQIVKNTRVLVISEKNHAVGLYDVSRKTGKKQGYKFQGRYFSPGNLHMLPRGVYWADNSYELEKFSIKNYKKYLDYVNTCPKVDANRKEILKNVIEKKLEDDLQKHYTKLKAHLIKAEKDPSFFSKFLETACKLFDEKSKFYTLLKEVQKNYLKKDFNTSIQLLSSYSPSLISEIKHNIKHDSLSFLQKLQEKKEK